MDRAGGVALLKQMLGPDAEFREGQGEAIDLSANRRLWSAEITKTGGTWAGAVEALKAGWCPVFVRDGDDAPTGNRELQKLGALPLTSDELGSIENLPTWMRDRVIAKPVERDLFGWAVRETAEGKG